MQKVGIACKIVYVLNGRPFGVFGPVFGLPGLKADSDIGVPVVINIAY